MKKHSKHSSRCLTVKKLADLLNCPFKGEGKTEIWAVASLEKAKQGELVFLSHRKYLPLLEKSKASAAIIPQGEKYNRIPVLKSENPHLTFVKAIGFLYKPRLLKPEIHPAAFISSSAKIGKDVTIGAFSYIGEEVEIGAESIIFPLAAIYPEVKIGKQTIIHSNVSIRERVRIGNKVVIHNGAVIGSDGFGYLQKEDKSHIKIPQLGTVIIEDEVEIGANTAVDRASLGETIIRRGTKIDNLVQVGHNVEIGENSILAGQAGISGSVKLGKNVIMAGQSGIADHVTIGDNVTIAAQAGVMKDIPDNAVMGAFQMDIKAFMRMAASLPRLPELVKTVRKMEAELEELKKKIK